jgi:hypothetical protein
VADDVALNGGGNLGLIGCARPDTHKVSEGANQKRGSNRDDNSNRSIHGASPDAAAEVC